MIEVGELRRLLSKFPDNYLALTIDDDMDSMLGIFTPNSPYNPLPPEPYGYIGMRTWGDAAIFVGDSIEEVGEDNVTKEVDRDNLT